MGAIIYLILGYWATGKTIYRNKVLVGSWQGIFIQRVAMGAVLGFILIPWAILAILFGK